MAEYLPNLHEALQHRKAWEGVGIERRKGEGREEEGRGGEIKDVREGGEDRKEETQF